MTSRVLIINPKSNPAVTAAMAEAVAPLAVSGGPARDCMTLGERPCAIESQADVEAVTLPLARLMRARDDADAFIIACFSDTGLAVCREVTARPVLGIQKCAVIAALLLDDRYGC
jgi:allantoin racemase